jgi:hypothetical protein
VLESAPESTAAPHAAELERILTLAARTAQTTLSIELTTTELSRLSEVSQGAISRINESAKSAELVAGSAKATISNLKALLAELRGLDPNAKQGRGQSAKSSVENIPIMTERG